MVKLEKFDHHHLVYNFTVPLSLSITLFSKEKEELLIMKWLFDETKLVVIRLPFAPRNEKFNKCFISKLQTFTNGKFKFNIIWSTCKIQSLFNSKGKVEHLSCIICKGVCSCSADYIGETICNNIIIWNEHESRIDKNSGFKQLQGHFRQAFEWTLLSIAAKNFR